jgi:hypothetical protein
MDTHKPNSVLDIRDGIAMVRGCVRGLQTFIEFDANTEMTKADDNLKERVEEQKIEFEISKRNGGTPLEELIEQERAALPPADELTPITEEIFMQYLQDEDAARLAKIAAEEKENAKILKKVRRSGRRRRRQSGRRRERVDKGGRERVEEKRGKRRGARTVHTRGTN